MKVQKLAIYAQVAEVSDVRLVPSEAAIESESDKQTVFDVACTLNGNEAANIEMQGIDVHASYDKRAEYNAAHLLNHYTPKGTNFREIPKVFQISVLNFVDFLNPALRSRVARRKSPSEI